MKVGVSKAEIAVGGFLIAAFLGFLVLLVGSGGWEGLGKSTFTVRAAFDEVPGIRSGSAVRMNGIEVGVVREVTLNDHGRVELVLELDARYRRHLRQTAEAEKWARSQAAAEHTDAGDEEGHKRREAQIEAFARAGNALVRVETPLLGGDSVVTIVPESFRAKDGTAEVADDGYLVARPPPRGIKEAVSKLDAVLADLLGEDKKGESLGTLLARVGKTLESLEKSVAQLEKVMAGAPESSVGRLMNDKGELYDKLSATVDRAGETLKGVDDAVKRTSDRLAGTLGNTDEKVNGIAADLEKTTAQLRDTLKSADELLGKIGDRGLLAALDSPDGSLRAQIDTLLARLEEVLGDLKTTTARLPGLADDGSNLIGGGKDAVGEVDAVVRATRRHWLLKGLFEPPRDEWLRAWDTGPGRGEK